MPTNPAEQPSSIAYRLLQQRLIDLTARSDRQLGRLVRLNRFSNYLLGHGNNMPAASTFAEAMIEVLDLEAGAVWILDRNAPAAEATAARLGCGVVIADVTRAEDVARAFERVAAESGGISVLVNNAAAPGEIGRAHV